MLRALGSQFRVMRQASFLRASSNLSDAAKLAENETYEAPDVKILDVDPASFEEVMQESKSPVMILFHKPGDADSDATRKLSESAVRMTGRITLAKVDVTHLANVGKPPRFLIAHKGRIGTAT